MKVNYKPTGTSRMGAPKQWEVWLADTPFGETGKKRCAVVVAKRTPAGYTVHEGYGIQGFHQLAGHVLDVEFCVDYHWRTVGYPI